MKARNRVFLLLGLLAVASLIWYLVSTRRSGDLQLIGRVDANEVLVSSKIPGRIQRLAVDEGQDVTAGDLIAVIESEDLEAARRAAIANVSSQRFKLDETRETQRQTQGEVSNATLNAEAQVRSLKAALTQAQAQFDRQQADTSRAVALARQGVFSEQSKDEAVTSLQAAQSAVDAARENVLAAEAALRQAHSHELMAAAAALTVDSTRGLLANVAAIAEEAKVQENYARVLAPVSGKINIRVMRQGEVVSAGSPIVTIMDLNETWIYAPLPETQADTVQLGDSLRVVLPSGATGQGQVINKAAEADFATQRDVNSWKRDIKTVRIKLLVNNPGERMVPGMTAEVYIPANRIVNR